MSLPNDPPKYGVLLVHGMGEQGRGDTLLQFGEPIIRYIRRVVASPGPVDSLNATPGIVDSEVIRINGLEAGQPANFTLIDPAEQQKSWLVAECWWANDVRPASFIDVVKWGLRVTPFVLNDTVRHQWKKSNRRVFVANAQLPLTILLGPIIQALLLLLIPISRLPLAGGVAGAVMTRLANSFGDPYLLLSSPLRFSSMVERVHRDIRWMKSHGCTEIAVIAHSQGAAIAHRALKTLPTDTGVVIKRFVTFGAAINKLHQLGEIEQDGGPRLKYGSFLNCIVVLMFCNFLLAWRLDFGTFDLGLRFELQGLLVVILFWLIGSITYWYLSLRATETPSDLRAGKWLEFEGEAGTPLIWQDFFARADPVSLGKLPIDYFWGYTSTEIRNRDSIPSDHTYYWRNTEQFIAPVAQGLMEDSDWSVASNPLLNPTARNERINRRSIRVDSLIHSFQFNSLTCIAAIALCWVTNLLGQIGGPVRALSSLVSKNLPVPFEVWLEGNIGNGPDAQNVQGILVIVLSSMAWFSFAIVTSWEGWNLKQVDAWFAQLPPNSNDGDRLFRAAKVGSFVFLLTVITSTIAVW